MKKALLCLLLIISLGSICARTAGLAFIEAVKDPAKLYQQALALRDQGVEIYYYNQGGFLVGLDSAKYVNVSQTFSTDGNLYLVGSPDGTLPQLPPDAGTALLQIGSVILLGTPLDEVALRQKIRYPFTHLELTPMRLPEAQSKSNFNPSHSVELQSLVNAVEVDSVVSHIQGLQDFGTRYCRADNRLAVSQWIRDRFISFGVPNVELHQFSWQDTDQYNVVATIPGCVYPDEYIIVGGHHDSINMDDPFLNSPGADDNASGTAACLEMARVMMASGYQPRRSIRFVTFAAEEHGMFGSYAYAYYAVVNGMNIRLMINHDMIANNTAAPGDWQVRLMPYEGSMEHSFRAQSITSLYTSMQTYFGTLNFHLSDGVPFWYVGYNVIYFFEHEFSPHYHSGDDIVANIDGNYCTEVIKASTAIAATFADLPQTPENLVVRDYGDGQSLHVAWDLSTDPTVSHYRVYWGNDQDDIANNYVDCTGNSYVLSGLNEATEYLIRVASVDACNNESVGAMGRGIPLVIPLTPAEFMDSPQRHCVKLSWQANGEYDLAGYKIYRSTAAEDPGSLLVTVAPSDASYRDHDVNGGLHCYYYRIFAFDHDGNMSAGSQVIRSRPASMDQGVLIVDQTRGASGSDILNPSDEMVDDFYDDMLEGFDPYLIDLEEVEDLKVADLGIFHCVIWHSNCRPDFVSGSAHNDALRGYIQLGGKVFFSVYYPGRRFEQSYRYPATFEAGRFVHDVLGIGEVDFKVQSRFKTALPLQEQYPIIEVDPLKCRPDMNNHIKGVEGMTPTDSAIAIYSYSSDYDNNSDEGYLNGKAVGIRNEYGYGAAITLSFPLYFMDADSAKALVQYVLNHDFVVPNPDEDTGLTPAAGLSLSLPSPNPFSNSMSITLRTKDFSKPTSLKVYNQRGQLVRTLLQDSPLNVEVFNWDARDNLGRKVSSGVYLLQAKQGKHSVSKKIVYMK